MASVAPALSHCGNQASLDRNWTPVSVIPSNNPPTVARTTERSPPMRAAPSAATMNSV